VIQNEETQLDRIERMLTDLMALKDVALKLAMPKVPARMREQVMRLAASRQDWED
jgi:hypothetical protein